MKGKPADKTDRQPLPADLPTVEGLIAATSAERVASLLDKLYLDAMTGDRQAAQIYLTYAVKRIELDRQISPVPEWER